MLQKLSPEVTDPQSASSSLAWYQALTLQERLASLRTSISQHELKNPDNPELAERRLQKWEQQAPFDQDVYFTERLEKDGTTEEELRYLLGEAPEALQSRVAEPPAWLETLEQILASSNSVQNIAFNVEGTQKSALFLNILKPWVKHGLERFQCEVRQLVGQYPSLPFQPETVVQFFLPDISQVLLSIVLKTFTMELNIARLQGELSGETPEERFEDFVRQLADPAKLRPFFARYPVLARELLTVVDYWVVYNLEFLAHLCADWPEICTQLAEGDPGVLEAAHMGAGDRHQQGRSVIRLTFSSGLKLIYKPRSLDIDVHFYALLHWLNEQGIEPLFRTLKVLAREDYGWIEFVEAQTCHSVEEVQHFYVRLGGYLALLYTLGATDFHHENLIASGEHPMLIDLESLIEPTLPFPQVTRSRGIDLLQRSVLRNGILPVRIWGNSEVDGVDISGLGGKGGQLSPHHISIPDEAGTDQMRMVRQRVQLQGSKNQPTLNDEELEFSEYQDQLLQGFTAVYRLLLHRRDLFLTTVLPAFAQDTVRVIPRATRTYAIVLRESLHPTLLHNALLRDRFFDQIWQSVPVLPFLSRIISAEIADMRVHDIPFFTACPGSRHIYTSQGECLEDFFAETALDGIIRHVQEFDAQDLTRQVWLIRASFATASIDEKQVHELDAPLYQRCATQPATRERLLQAACAVGERLCDFALIGQDEVSWIGLHLIQEREWKVLAGGVGLYDGLAGIALFLAHLGAITRKQKYSDLARLAFQALRQQITNLPDPLPVPGVFSGWGAIFYLAAHLGTLWHEPELFNEAEKLVERFAEVEVQDEAFNILTGSAGAILSLLNLYSVAPSARTLQVAVKLGDHLLAHATPLAQGCGWIEARATRPLAGFSHGVSGIALSLFALASVSGEERFHKTALSALAYEGSIFSAQKQNWPDLQGDAERDRTTWCHGAPGVGLARLASLPYHDDAATREEIAVALQATLANGFRCNHSLCHGSLGNLETVLVASQVLNDAHYRAEVERLAALILEDIEQNGWRTGVPQCIETPGLMTGIAGIGYELLRLAEPALVPSVLSLAFPSSTQEVFSIEKE